MPDAPSTSTSGTDSTASTSTTTTQKSKGSIIPLILLVGWVLSGIAAIIMSIVCFGFSGNMVEKIVGLALAFFLGPLYFIFYGVNKTYCRSMTTNVSGAVNRMMGGFSTAL